MKSQLVMVTLCCVIACSLFAVKPLRKGILDKVSQVSADIGARVSRQYYQIALTPDILKKIERLLRQDSPSLSDDVIKKVMLTLSCSQSYALDHHNILTIIDYSLPSSAKRLWIYNLKTQQRLFHTYVSHGITSGSLLTQFFSNKYNSKASSIGVYKTEKAYYGREGLSLRLQGLERGFNDNASNRAIVMHGGWYMDENFIRKYGRPGRSWGCPALPLTLSKAIINTIKDQSLMVIYYPRDDWFIQSKFLNCKRLAALTPISSSVEQLTPFSDERDEVLFADLNQNNKRDESEPVVAISADDYQRLFHSVTLSRMLRRQMLNKEYIALSASEFKTIAAKSHSVERSDDQLNLVYLIRPTIKQDHGYYITEMVETPLGKIKEVLITEENQRSHYALQYDKKGRVNLIVSNVFIRWLGL